MKGTFFNIKFFLLFGLISFPIYLAGQVKSNLDNFSFAGDTISGDYLDVLTKRKVDTILSVSTNHNPMETYWYLIQGKLYIRSLNYIESRNCYVAEKENEVLEKNQKESFLENLNSIIKENLQMPCTHCQDCASDGKYVGDWSRIDVYLYYYKRLESKDWKAYTLLNFPICSKKKKGKKGKLIRKEREIGGRLEQLTKNYYEKNNKN